MQLENSISRATACICPFVTGGISFARAAGREIEALSRSIQLQAHSQKDTHKSASTTNILLQEDEKPIAATTPCPSGNGLQVHVELEDAIVSRSSTTRSHQGSVWKEECVGCCVALFEFVVVVILLLTCRRPSSFTELVVITGTSSGLGRKTAIALLRTGEYHVIGAVRDVDKMEAVAEVDGFPKECFTTMKCDLNSFESVHEFCDQVNEFRMDKPIDRLLCNAGIYQPSLPYAKWSEDDLEQTMQTNYLSHFLMVRYVHEHVMHCCSSHIAPITVSSHMTPITSSYTTAK